MSDETPRPPAPLAKLLIEVGPLAVFFLVYAKWGIFTATGVFMVTSVISLSVSWAREHRLPVVPLVTAAVVLVFGGLTLLLQDETFFKMKLTIINGLFCAVLLGGLAFGRPLIKPILGAAIQLTDEGWRAITVRWIVYFALVGVLNEVVRLNFSTDVWVKWKVFGVLGLTFLFVLSLTPLIQRYEVRAEES